VVRLPQDWFGSATLAVVSTASPVTPTFRNAITSGP
jgi:hypothetical protein